LNWTIEKHKKLSKVHCDGAFQFQPLQTIESTERKFEARERSDERRSQHRDSIGIA
jgi:hypothetical protein